MNIYIAAKVTARHRLKETRVEIQALGHKVVSTWLDTADDYGDAVLTEEIMRFKGEVDLDEVELGELFIMDTIDESTTGGRECELGALLALRRLGVSHPGLARFADVKIWRVGPVRNLYHVWADRVFPSWIEAMNALMEMS